MEKFEKLVRLVRKLDYFFYEDGWASDFKDVINKGIEDGILTDDEVDVLYKLYRINEREEWEEKFYEKEQKEDEENW